MKASYTTQNGRITVEVEGDTQKSLFEQIGKFQEVFEQTQCGKCGSENILKPCAAGPRVIHVGMIFEVDGQYCRCTCALRPGRPRTTWCLLVLGPRAKPISITRNIFNKSE